MTMTSEDDRMYWYNFRTQEYELRDTPSNMSDYISQHPAAQGAYKCHLALGKTPLEAALAVMNVIVEQVTP
jgi:hypothetical protein